MQTKNRIIVGFIGSLLVASLLLLSFSAPKNEKTPTCCKKSSEGCTIEKNPNAAPETNLENLSHQFIAFPVFLH